MVRTHRRMAFSVALALIVALVVTACAGPAAPPAAPAAQPTQAAPAAQPTKAPAAAKKDTVVIAQSGTGSFGTTMDMGDYTAWLNEPFNIHEPLVKLVFEGEQVLTKPGIAESWKVVNDTTYEFRIRKGVKFQNGETVTTKDVAFSLNRILDKENKLKALTYLQYFKEAKAVDDSTVVFTTIEPHAAAIFRLTFLTIIPEKYYQEVGRERFSTQPVGAGPYKLIEWIKGDKVTLEAFPDYYLGAPKIKRLIFRNVKEAATRVAMLQSGEADVIDNVPPQYLGPFQSDPNYTVQVVRTTREVFIGMNYLKPDPNPYRDIRVRQALNYAVDWDSIIKNVLRGNAFRLSSLVGGRHAGYDTSLKPYPYDVAKAKELMAAAGYANGFETTFDGSAGRLFMDKEVAQAVTSQLEKNLGLKFQMFIQDWGGYWEKFLNKRFEGLYYMSCGNLIGDGEMCVQLHLHSKVRGIYYNTPRMDALLDDQAKELDPAKRAGKFNTLQKAIQEEAMAIFAYDEGQPYVSRKNLKWAPRPDEWIGFYGSEWQ
ncbi:MAG: hypothetical protein HY331_09505 [Chloroflexi bacterium]|nr:hypothetical protein [Chloroflexota bacterium]